MTDPDVSGQPTPARTQLPPLSRNDQIFLGAGFLTFVFSFIAFAHITIKGFGSDTITAWHGVGALAGILTLLSLVVGGLLALAPQTLHQVPVSARFVAVALATLALLFYLIRWATLPSASGFGFSFGYSLYWGGYITLILNVVQIAGGVLGLRESGDPMPWAGRGGATTA